MMDTAQSDTSQRNPAGLVQMPPPMASPGSPQPAPVPARPRAAGQGWVGALIAAGVFVLLAGLLTWPRLANAATSVVDSGDPLEDIWTLRWIDQALLSDPARLYDAPIFHGFPLPLAYDDTSLGPALVALPLTALTGSMVLTYNLLIVASFALAGWSAFLLARHVTGSAAAGIVAGMVYGFWSYTFAHISHLSVLSLYPLPLALLCLHHVFESAGRLPPARPDRRAARRVPPAALWTLGFAALFIWQALHSFYYAAYLALAAGGLVAWEGLGARRWRGWTGRTRLQVAGGLLAAGLVCGLALAVLSAPYREVQRQFGFYRSSAEQTAWAARPADYLGVSPRNRTYEGVLPIVWPEPLFPGFAVLGLGAVGLGLGGRALLRRRARPRALSGDAPPAAPPSALGFYAGLAGLGVVLSLGPVLDLGAIQVPLPYRILSALPGFSGLRSPVRLVVLAALGWGVLAGWGWRGVLAGVIRRLGPSPAVRPRRLVVPATVLLLGVLSWEQWTVLTPTTPLPHAGTVPPAYQWLAAHPDGGVLAEFPVIAGLRDPTRTTTRMYDQGSHGHPLLNGYSSFIPPAYSQIVHLLDQDVAVTPQDIGVLQSLDVRYILFNRPAYKKAHWQQIMRDMTGYPEARLIAQYGDEFHGDALYRLAPLPAAAHLRLSGALPPRLLPGPMVPLTVTISNGYRYALLTRLQPRLALEAAWGRVTGAGAAPPAVWPLRGEVDLPLVLPPGTHTFATTIPAPPAGRYVLYLRVVPPAPAYQPIVPLPPVDVP